MTTKDYSSKQEKMIADYLGWEVVSGSGAAPCVPGDVISYNWLGECKTHTSVRNFVMFMSEHWQKIKDESIIKRRNPVLFCDDGTQRSTNTWCLFELKWLSGREYEGHHLKSLNKINRTNLKLDPAELKSVRRQKDPVVFVSLLNKEQVGIVSLSTFEELFRE